MSYGDRSEGGHPKFLSTHPPSRALVQFVLIMLFRVEGRRAYYWYMCQRLMGYGIGIPPGRSVRTARF